MPNSIAILLLAATFAAERHCDQRRKDLVASPYINHPIAVATVLAAAGIWSYVSIDTFWFVVADQFKPTFPKTHTFSGTAKKPPFFARSFNNSYDC
ncbi:MAG: hypothetical protein ACI87E_004767 [Mariniblastus sp.]|jgi:hypothetical protein